MCNLELQVVCVLCFVYFCIPLYISVYLCIFIVHHCYPLAQWLPSTVSFFLSLPTNQDCHEMWSRKRRKKERSDAPRSGKARYHEDSSGSAKQDVQIPFVSRPSSPSPLGTGKEREGSHPPSNRTTRGYSAEPKPTSVQAASVGSYEPGVKPQLSVPLPSAPLTVGILESLSSSIGEVNNGNTEQPLSSQQQPPSCSSSAPSTSTVSVPAKTSLQIKQVIAEAQRNLINQLQQELEESAHSSATSSTAAPKFSSRSQHQLGSNSKVVSNFRDRVLDEESGSLVSSISGRHTQTFDYGNQSNKELEKAADEQLKRNYYGDHNWNV